MIGNRAHHAKPTVRTSNSSVGHMIVSGSADAEQAFLVPCSGRGPVAGSLFAFDSRGEEVERRRVESSA
jgi:hypothetical protein